MYTLCQNILITPHIKQRHRYKRERANLSKQNKAAYIFNIFLFVTNMI